MRQRLELWYTGVLAPFWVSMSLNPAAKRLVSRYSKLNSADKDTFLERKAFNYKDARFIRSLVDWAAESDLPQFLAKFLHDANSVNDTVLIDYVVERIFRNRTTLKEHGAELFHAWVGSSNFDCERACVKSSESWDLKWIHNLIPHITNEDVRYLAYNSVVRFLEPVTVDSGFCNPERIIKPYYDRIILCLAADEQCENMMRRLHNDCPPSPFLEAISCGAQKQRLHQEIKSPSSDKTSRKI